MAVKTPRLAEPVVLLRSCVVHFQPIYHDTPVCFFFHVPHTLILPVAFSFPTSVLDAFCLWATTLIPPDGYRGPYTGAAVARCKDGVLL